MTDRPTNPIEPNQPDGSAPRAFAESIAHGAGTASDLHAERSAMDCTGLQAVVSGFVDGELADDDHGLAERHLVGCAECRTLVDRVEAIDDDLRALAGLWAADAPMPMRVVSGVLDRTTRPGRRERRWRIAGAIGWATAAAIALSWIATARVGFTPDRARSPDRPTQVVAHESPENLRPVRRASAAEPPTPRRAGIAQSPANRGPCEHSKRPLGLEATLPALHGKHDWSHAKAQCSDERVKDNSKESALACADERSEARVCDKEWTGECAAERFGLRPADSDTIFATSLLLDRLLRVDAGNLDEIERLRYVIVYDELIERLRDARQRLESQDRPLASLAQCFLVRLLRGSVEESVILEMQTDLQNVGLHDRLEALSDRLERRPTF